MNTLLLGGGGREHALARVLSHSPRVNRLYAAPGNPGIAQVATCVSLPITDPDAVMQWAKTHDIDVVVIGPEAPLVVGVGDVLRKAGIACFGPDAAAAQLEGSKTFAKEIMEAAHVPTARSFSCRSLDQVEDALDEFGAPYVVKDDGLAAGKGVVVTSQRDQALSHARACLSHEDGCVVVEEYLDGPELSLFCVSDGTRVVPLTPAQDFKRAYDGQRGPNTGGMGAYAPLPWAGEDIIRDIVTHVAQPTIDEMARRGTPFVGLLYCGLALTHRGIRVVEFNARFGDPETQVVLPVEGDEVADLILDAATGHLSADVDRTHASSAAVTVVVANEGYPGTLAQAGRVITGVDKAESREGVHVIHAGTATDDEGNLRATGGRVLNVVAVADTLDHARERAYQAVKDIHLIGAHYRSDIADPQAMPRL